MRKIASTNELQTELRRLLAYSKGERPSRTRVAGELVRIGQSLLGTQKQAAPRLDIRIDSDFDEAMNLLFSIKGELADTISKLKASEGSFLDNPSITRAYQGALADITHALDLLSHLRQRFA